jgi:hypothetical protein
VGAEIVLRGAGIAVEIVVAAGVLEAVVDVVAGAADVPEAAVAVVDVTVVTAAVAEDGTKLLPRIFTDSTDKPRRTAEIAVLFLCSGADMI